MFVVCSLGLFILCCFRVCVYMSVCCCYFGVMWFLSFFCFICLFLFCFVCRVRVFCVVLARFVVGAVIVFVMRVFGGCLSVCVVFSCCLVAFDMCLCVVLC